MSSQVLAGSDITRKGKTWLLPFVHHQGIARKQALVITAPAEPIIISTLAAVRSTSTPLVFAGPPRPIICSGDVAMPSRPTVTINADRPDMKPMLCTTPNIGWQWIVGMSHQPQQALVNTTVALVAVSRGATHDNAAAIITEYNEDEEAHLPVVSSKQVPQPCATGSGFKTPLQIQGSPSVVSVRVCGRKEEASVNVPPGTRELLGSIKLGYKAFVSMFIIFSGHHTY
jgi:hypothetical protein